MSKLEPIKDKLSGLYQQITGAAQEATEQIARIDAGITVRLAERSELETAPLTKEDFMAQFRAKIKAAGEAHGTLLRHAMSKVDRSIHYASRNDPGVDFLLAGRGIGNQQVSQIALCYFFEEAIVSGVEKIADTLTWPEKGAKSLPVMLARIKVLDSEISALEEERAAYIGVLKSYKIVND